MFNFNDHLQELRSTIIGLALLLAATIIGFVWVSIGLYHWLSICLGAIWGPIVLGLIYFVPLVIFAFIKAFIRQPALPVTSHNEGADLTALNIAKVFENLAGRSPFVVASAAILAGFLATRFPALLSVFMQILTVYAEDVKNRAARAAANQADQPYSASDSSK
jgi:hypothetical protein